MTLDTVVLYEWNNLLKHPVESRTANERANDASARTEKRGCESIRKYQTGNCCADCMTARSYFRTDCRRHVFSPFSTELLLFAFSGSADSTSELNCDEMEVCSSGKSTPLICRGVFRRAAAIGFCVFRPMRIPRVDTRELVFRFARKGNVYRGGSMGTV